MKKVMIIILAALACLALVACNSTKPAAAAPAAAPAAAAPAAVSTAPENGFPDGETLWEGWESDLFWKAIGKDWDNTDPDMSIGMYKSDEHVTEGESSIELAYDVSRLVAARSKASYTIVAPELFNWTGVKSIKMDFFNTEEVQVDVAFVTQNGADWAWEQTPEYRIQPGENKDFEIPLPAYKAPQDIKQIFFCLFFKDGAKTGKLYMDNLRVVK
jgi:hypothetical protein